MTTENEEASSVLYSTKRRWWRDLAFGALILLCGCLIGSMVTARFYVKRLEHIQQHGVDIRQGFGRLQRALDLDDAQSEQVRAILQQGMEELRGLRQSFRPQVDVVMDRIFAEVAATLNEQQKLLWEERFGTMRKRWLPRLPEKGEPRR